MKPPWPFEGRTAPFCRRDQLRRDDGAKHENNGLIVFRRSTRLGESNHLSSAPANIPLMAGLV